MKKIVVIALLCAMVTGMAFARGNQETGAENFPTRPVTAMVAWAAGGGGDLVFRALGEAFQRVTGQPLIIVNRGEAAGVPGIMDFKLNASADGYNIMHWNLAHVIKTHWDEVPFTATEFVPVARVVVASNFLLVPTGSRWNTLQDYINYARANPGQVSIGNAGVGGGNHLAAVLFERVAGIQLRHVPFAGGGPSVTGLLTGDVVSSMNTPPEGAPQTSAGQLRMLAVFGENRLSEFPNVPTGREAGLDLVSDQWRGVVVPAGTPPAIVARLEDIFRQCVQDPAFVERMRGMGSTAAFTDARTFGQIVADDDARIGAMLREGRIGNRYR